MNFRDLSRTEIGMGLTRVTVWVVGRVDMECKDGEMYILDGVYQKSHMVLI